MLNESNFLQFAMRHYARPSCTSLNDFNDDLQRIKHLKKLLNKIINGKPVKIQLVLNHMTILYNVFDMNACTAMLFYKVDSQYWSILKTILTHFNIMPDFIPELGIVTTSIKIDENILKELEKL
jgi:hypothetical protein